MSPAIRGANLAMSSFLTLSTLKLQHPHTLAFGKCLVWFSVVSKELLLRLRRRLEWLSRNQVFLHIKISVEFKCNPFERRNRFGEGGIFMVRFMVQLMVLQILLL